jgi:hypothetical protein
VKNDRAMGMLMGGSWRVVHIILKNALLFFGGFFAILNLPSVFRHSVSPKKLLGKEPFADKMFARQRTICR